MYLGDVEVWRTSTAEPIKSPGIRWEYHKNMTPFLSLWRQEQIIIFNLGNLVNNVYTGWFNTTMVATFFYVPENKEKHSKHPDGMSHPAHLILPISKLFGNKGMDSRFTLPQDVARVSVMPGAFPKNSQRAVFTISANGQASEEFWWSNAMESTKDFFKDSSNESLPGFSPWREVQVLIDGKLAGVYWPFPVIFTGGVSPGLHRPNVGIQAFDLTEHEIDITPWLGVLCDGYEHTFEMKVAGINDTGKNITITEQVGSNWVITGKIFIWLGSDKNAVTVGPSPNVKSSDFMTKIKQIPGKNDTELLYQLEVQRSIEVSNTIIFDGGESIKTVSWTQDLSYTNDGLIYNSSHGQRNVMNISGVEAVRRSSPSKDFALGSSALYYKNTFSYPLEVDSIYHRSGEGNLSIEAFMLQGLSLVLEGTHKVFPTNMAWFTDIYTEQFLPTRASASFESWNGAFLDTEKSGTASFFLTGDRKHSSGFGRTRQKFVFGSMIRDNAPEKSKRIRLYFRDVESINETIVQDIEFCWRNYEKALVEQSISPVDEYLSAEKQL